MDSLQTNPKFDRKFDQSKFNQTAQEEHRVVTEAKLGTEHKPKSPQVTWCESSVTINGKTHPLPTTKEYILQEYTDVFKGVGTLPGGPYHIQLKDSYKPVQHPLQSSNSKTKESNIDIIPVHHITQNAPVSQTRLQELRLATQSDPTLCSLSKTTYEGWPQSKKDCPEQLLEFWDFRQEIIVPHSERLETLKVLQMGHYAVDKMQLRALETVFWPGINKDITKQYQHCKTCIRHSKSQPREPLQPHPTPETPWHTVATDLFEIRNSKYLLIVDYYSRFPVLCKLASTARILIQEMKAVFTELGVPSVIVSDGGPQYTSVEFKDFMKQWQIEHHDIHDISSP